MGITAEEALGASMAYTNKKVSESAALHREIVSSLPATGDDTTIYMILDQTASEPDIYDEWMWINGRYEHIGSTRVDLTDYYNKTQVDTALNGKQDVLTFDNVPTRDSSNPVKSGGVFSTIDDVYSVMGQMGAKNLIPYPYYRESGYSSNGMTTAYDSDGVLTINKVAGSSTAYFSLIVNDQDYCFKPNTEYKLLFELENANQLTIYLKYGDTDIVLINKKSTGKYVVNFTTPPTLQGRENFALNAAASDTETNAKVKVMIMLASDTDETYQPYAKTNKQLTDGKAELESVRDYVNELGVKNLIPYPFYETTKTQNGVTFTDNGDGSITVDTAGEASTGNAIFYCQTPSVVSNLIKLDKNKTYILSDTTKSSVASTSTLGIRYFAEGVVPSTSTGTAVSCNSSNNWQAKISNAVCAFVYIYVFSGKTVNNITFKPMLRLASDINDDTYVQYAMTNKQLTEKKADSATTLAGYGITDAYTKSEVNSALSGKASTSDIPTALSQLSADTTHRVVTDTEKITWNGKSNITQSDVDATVNALIKKEAINISISSIAANSWGTANKKMTIPEGYSVLGIVSVGGSSVAPEGAFWSPSNNNVYINYWNHTNQTLYNDAVYCTVLYIKNS